RVISFCSILEQFRPGEHCARHTRKIAVCRRDRRAVLWKIMYSFCERSERTCYRQARFERRIQHVIPEMLVNLDSERFFPQISEAIRLLDVPDKGLSVRRVPSLVVEDSLDQHAAPDVVESIESDRVEAHQQVVRGGHDAAVVAHVHRAKWERHTRWNNFVASVQYNRFRLAHANE